MPIAAYDEMIKATAEAFENPRVGDRFHEMYSFWFYVVDVGEDSVWTLEGSPPCEFPKDATLCSYTREQYKQHFAYNGIPGYWVMLADRDNDVDGWLESKTLADVNPEDCDHRFEWVPGGGDPAAPHEPVKVCTECGANTENMED